MTKLTVLSIVSQIFDPLGLVGPATIKTKIIIQKLWQLNLGRVATNGLATNGLHMSKNWIASTTSPFLEHPTLVELHGFSDASESAYSAYVYLRSGNKEGDVTVRLVCAKSRMASLKTVCSFRVWRIPMRILMWIPIAVEISQFGCPSSYHTTKQSILLMWFYYRAGMDLRQGLIFEKLDQSFVANRLTKIHHVIDVNNDATWDPSITQQMWFREESVPVS